MYGVNIDVEMGGDEFEYLIAEDYSKEKEGMEGYVVKTIQGLLGLFSLLWTNASSIQEVNKKYFAEVVTNCIDYEINRQGII